MFYSFVMENIEICKFLIQKGLIKDSMACNYCLELMDMKESNDNPETYNWRCMNTLCIHYQTTKSIRLGSFFQSFQAPIMEVYNTISLYCTLPRQIDVVKQSKMSKSFIKNLRKKIILKMCEYFEQHPIRLGGPGVVVQVDETKINFNAKSHRGLGPSTPCWAFCIVDTSHSPAKGYIELIERRNAESLLPIISKVVRPGSIIHSDEWRAYNQIEKTGIYEHMKVVHKYNFVDPDTGTHTQHVESFNNKIKYKIKMAKGVPKDFRPKFITEFLFFDTFKECVFEKFLDIIKVIN